MNNNKPDLKGLSMLVMENDASSLKTIGQALKAAGARVFKAQSFAVAKGVLKKNSPSVIIAALELINEQCLEMIKDYKAVNPRSLFFVLAGDEYSSIEISQESYRHTVDDYIAKPLDVVRFAGMVQTSTGRTPAESTSLAVIDPLIAKAKPYFLFRSPVMRHTLAGLPQIADSDQTVLITGETGTGKEIVARAINALSRRSSGPFVTVNCGAVPESLIEGELFGHEKGAFTGAIRTRKGKFEISDKGTLFLDEIGDMPLNLQVRLLRAIEEGIIYRLGGEAPLPVNVRVIAASNIDLQKAVEDKLFREDLFYRLNVLRIHLPPLRERIEDISLLVVHFLERAFSEMNWLRPYPSLSHETIYLLENRQWQGNVRELRNVMTRIATLLPRDTKRIFPFHVLPHLDVSVQTSASASANQPGQGVFIPFGTRISDAENMLINETLKHTKRNKTKTASMLGVSLRNLRRKLNKS